MPVVSSLAEFDKAVALKMSEQQLLDAVVDLAHFYGWKVAHFRPAMTAKGWRTPVSADGKGFPDLVLVKGRVIFVELKSQKGKVTEEQYLWGQALVKSRQEYYFFRPSDWMDGTIKALLEL